MNLSLLDTTGATSFVMVSISFWKITIELKNIPRIFLTPVVWFFWGKNGSFLGLTADNHSGFIIASSGSCFRDGAVSLQIISSVYLLSVYLLPFFLSCLLIQFYILFFKIYCKKFTC